MPFLGDFDFAVKYGSRAAELGVVADDLYQALVDTAENTVRDDPLFRIILLICSFRTAARLVSRSVSP